MANTSNLNATCSICGKKYHLCNSCQNATSFTPWRRVACSNNCYKIYMTLSSYTNKHIKKEEACDELSNCNLNELDTFQTHIKDAINDIISSTKKTKNKKKNDLEIEIEKESVDSSIDDILKLVNSEEKI